MKKTFPVFIGAILLLGTPFLAFAKDEPAEKTLAEKASDDDVQSLGLADKLLAQNDTDDALRIYKNIARKANTPEEIQVRAAIGEMKILAEKNDTDEALKIGNSLLKKNLKQNEKSAVSFQLGQIYFEKNNDTDAEKFLKTALEMAPADKKKNCAEWLNLVFLKQGKNEEAEKIQSNFLSKNDDDTGKNELKNQRLREWFSEGKLTDESVLGKQNGTVQLAKTADTLFAGMNYSDAQKTYAKATKQPTISLNELGYCQLQEARCWIQLENPKKAAEILKRFNDKKYQTCTWTPAALLRLASLYSGHLNDWKNAKKTYSLMVEKFSGKPETEEGHYYLIVLCTIHKEWNDADKFAKSFLKTYPKSVAIETLEKNTIPNIQKNLKEIKK